MDPASVTAALEIASLVAQMMTQGATLISQAEQAATTGDQATLDGLRAQAIAGANALAPAGATPLT